MRSKLQLKTRANELADEVEKATASYESGRMTTKAFRAAIDAASEESKEIRSEFKAFEQVAKYSGATELVEGTYPPGGDVPDYGRIVPPSPLDLTPQQLSGLIAAANARTPYSVEIKPKSFREGIRTKAPTFESGITGGFTGNLPPVQSLYAVGLPYEPTRIADLIPGAAMPGPSATWLQHSSNTNEAGLAAEGASKVDLGAVVTEHQVIPSKIAGQASCTLEVWQDTDKYGEGQFSQWLPIELTRSLINAESNALLNATIGGGYAFTGLLQTSGTLTRSMGTDTPLDCLGKSYQDVRASANAFATPDLVLVHPNTLGALRRQKDDTGRYLMDLIAGPLNLTAWGEPATAGPAKEPNNYSLIPQGSPGFAGMLWGAQLVATSQVPAGTALVMSVKAGAGIFWQRLGLLVMFNPFIQMTSNILLWVAEERIALSVPRPSAINIVTGLPVS